MEKELSRQGISMCKDPTLAKSHLWRGEWGWARPAQSKEAEWNELGVERPLQTAAHTGPGSHGEALLLSSCLNTWKDVWVEAISLKAVSLCLGRWLLYVYKTDNNKCCWQGWGGTGTIVHCCQECKVLSPTWKAVGQSLKTLSVELTQDPAIHSWVYFRNNWKQGLECLFVDPCSGHH